MNFDPKAVRRALMVAKNLAASVDPGFANINVPMPPEGVPLERAKGGPINAVQGTERDQNLKEWLGNSFLHVDGVPRTYYHGTSKDTPFSSFKVGRHGAWFASDPKEASMYATQNDSMSSRYEGGRFIPINTASRVMPVYLKANNPYMGEFPEKYKNVDNYKKAQSDWFDELRSAGYDSWVPRSQQGNLAVMLEGPHQVKSAVGNDGTFDHPTDITKAEGGEVDAPQGYTPQPPGTLETDNPGGEWLEEKKQLSESRGYRPSGAPMSFGSVTAVWRDKKTNDMAPVYLPVSMLKQIPGVMSEQQNVREHSLSGLVEHMGSTGRLPKSGADSDREYHPFITVDQRGMPFVSEGNHRIMAADRLGWKWLPVELRYFNGAEQVDGPLHPDRIRALHGIGPAKKAEGGAVDDELQQRQLNRMGMYSAAADAARALPQGVGTPQQMLASLKGVKPDELQWSGAQQAFVDKPRVTKDELAQHFEGNLPKLRVNTLYDDDPDAAINEFKDYKLVLPGGSNYKEDLIHLDREDERKKKAVYTPDPNLVAKEKEPTQVKGALGWRSTEKNYDIYDANGNLVGEAGGPYVYSPEGAIDSYHRSKKYRAELDWNKLNTFSSSHYKNQDNIVAHVRRADRIGPDKEKILHLEEVQSDWGQTARDKGLNNPIVAGTVVPEEQGTWRINWPDQTYSAGYGSKETAEQLAKERAIEKSRYVPSGPYIDTTNKWTDVALKHTLSEAAKGNYDSIIWTPGKAQAERYKLDDSKGMQSYYDKILPGRLLALAQEHDPKAKLETLDHPNDEHVNGFPMLKITPRMRESIKKRGFKAFSTGGFAMPKPVDADKTIRRALMIAKARGGKISTFQQMADAPPADPSITPTANPKRILFSAEGKGGVKGIVVPRHMWEGGKKSIGLREINKARAEVYGSENRDPLTIGQVNKIHTQTLEDHFAKPISQQIADETAALNRLRKAKHISKDANTLDESEKLDTVRHETDDQGRTYIGFASKGVAGHALYTSGYGDNEKKMVLNTCPGQTTGCGGGISPEGIVDTSKGTCFAPNAEAQYAGAAARRACHEQAKHDPAMTRDWILTHVGSLRKAANNADENNQVVLFRPNVVDETDTTSRYVIQNLNKQRQAEGKPNIVANSYGKTNELHDPENGYFVTHSNVGPKTKMGYSISENISRDNQRIRSTIQAADARGKDFKNEKGNLTPPKNSYMVTDVKRYSPLDQAMQKAITHAKYWSTGRDQNQLSDAELTEGPEGHFDGNGNPTTPNMAHYGHTTLNGRRYDYQKQHILHPRLVQVGNNDDGTPHMIPTDSRFKDNEFLPEDRFMTKNGKQAGAILMTTPTESTSTILRQTPFTHHVNEDHVQYALQNNGEYQIDPPDQQEASRGKEYVQPQPVFFRAEGGRVDNVHIDRQSDDPHAFPEQNFVTQMHMAKRLGDDESHLHEVRKGKKPLPVDAANVNKALQIARKFSPVPGMMVTVRK